MGESDLQRQLKSMSEADRHDLIRRINMWLGLPLGDGIVQPTAQKRRQVDLVRVGDLRHSCGDITIANSRLSDIRRISADAVKIDGLSFSLGSTIQNVEGYVSDITISGLSSLRVGRNGNSIRVNGDISIAGDYNLYGTVSNVRYETQGRIRLTATGFETWGPIDTIAIDDTVTAAKSFSLNYTAPSMKINCEDRVLETSLQEILDDLLMNLKSYRQPSPECNII